MLNHIKYSFLRVLEKVPFVQILLYNNISLFSFLFPHEKDYYGLKIIFRKKKQGAFIDVGGNIGLSIIGFRSLGFKNKIYVYEPDKFCLKKLRKIKKKYNNIYIYNYGLGAKSQRKKYYQPYFFGLKFHFLSSFDLDYLQKTLKEFYGPFGKFFKISSSFLNIKRFDDAYIKKKIAFIKIDVEGSDHQVLRGMIKHINKFKPIILVEFNSENILKIIKILKKKYNYYFYNFKKNKLEKKTYKDILIIKKNYNRKSDLTFPRNIYFIEKKTIL